jgi:hypothetical protein
LQSRSSRVRRDVPEKHGKYDVILSKEAGLLDPRPAGIGRIEPKTTQGCLPKSCHSLNLGIENFTGRLNGRLWPFAALKIRNAQFADFYQLFTSACLAPFFNGTSIDMRVEAVYAPALSAGNKRGCKGSCAYDCLSI